MGRDHVVLLDRSGYQAYRHEDGTPFLDPAEYQVTLVTLPAKADTVRPGEVDTVIPTNVLDPAALLAVAPTLADQRVDYVAAAGERFLVPAAQFRETLGLPGFRVEQMEVFRDKRVMKAHFRSHGVATPEYLSITRPSDAAALLDKHGTLILKPVDAMGSMGVHRVDRQAELAALDAQGLDGQYEAEQFITGTMFHIDSVVQDGQSLVSTASQYLDPNSFLQLDSQCRSATVDAGPLLDRLLEFNRQVLAAVEWFSGVTHLEVFRTTDDELIFCEIAGRPGGGGIIPGFAHRFGLNLPVVALLPQLDRPMPEIVERQPVDRRAIGWSLIYPPHEGILRQLGPEPAADWLIELKLLKQPGDQLYRPTSFGMGIALPTVCGPDAATVTARLDAVRADLPVTVEETP